MRKIFILIFALSFIAPNLKSQTDAALVDSLTTIDSELMKLFPRWKVCEPDLQVQIYKAFELLGFPKRNLSMQEIEVLAAPRKTLLDPFEILLITCGSETMKSTEIERDMSSIADYLSGANDYDPTKKEVRNRNLAEINNVDKEFDMVRSYCYIDIPPELPVKPSQANAIQNYMKPTDKNQAIVISLFEQSLKIGDTGFWLTNSVGNDEVGLPFYTAGESKLFLKRPLYINEDSETRNAIPYLINLTLGGVYRITSGLDNASGLFSWLPTRALNSHPNGKIKAGFEVHMPFHPQFGFALNAELPLQDIVSQDIELDKWGVSSNPNAGYSPTSPNRGRTGLGVVPILGATGQITAFYHLWIGDMLPENYFRFEAGINYNEVQEFFLDSTFEGGAPRYTISREDGIEGLRLFSPREFGDWVYAKVEYRNQSVFPFGATVQYSNQSLFLKGFFPLLGNWLFLEAKYSTPLRGTRPFEIGSFFMISPLIRITL